MLYCIIFSCTMWVGRARLLYGRGRVEGRAHRRARRYAAAYVFLLFCFFFCFFVFFWFFCFLLFLTQVVQISLFFLVWFLLSLLFQMSFSNRNISTPPPPPHRGWSGRGASAGVRQARSRGALRPAPEAVAVDAGSRPLDTGLVCFKGFCSF